jgi:hypothetical protein
MRGISLILKGKCGKSASTLAALLRMMRRMNPRCRARASGPTIPICASHITSRLNSILAGSPRHVTQLAPVAGNARNLKHLACERTQAACSPRGSGIPVEDRLTLAPASKGGYQTIYTELPSTVQGEQHLSVIPRSGPNRVLSSHRRNLLANTSATRRRFERILRCARRAARFLSRL